MAAGKDEPVFVNHGCLFEGEEDEGRTGSGGDFEFVREEKLTERKDGDLVVFDANGESEEDEESSDEEEGDVGAKKRTENGQTEEDSDGDGSDEEDSQDEEEDSDVEFLCSSDGLQVAGSKKLHGKIDQLKSERRVLMFLLVVTLAICTTTVMLHFGAGQVWATKNKELLEKVKVLSEKVSEQEKIISESSTNVHQVPVPRSRNWLVDIMMISLLPISYVVVSNARSRMAEKERQMHALKEKLAMAAENVAKLKEKERKRQTIKYQNRRKLIIPS